MIVNTFKSCFQPYRIYFEIITGHWALGLGTLIETAQCPDKDIWSLLSATIHDYFSV